MSLAVSESGCQRVRLSVSQAVSESTLPYIYQSMGLTVNKSDHQCLQTPLVTDSLLSECPDVQKSLYSQRGRRRYGPGQPEPAAVPDLLDRPVHPEHVQEVTDQLLGALLDLRHLVLDTAGSSEQEAVAGSRVEVGSRENLQ